ncbi:MAG TPA: aldo/keto reductase, partial [Terriglobia bacterium]|nr:aldo/keto reductase [Terriglobia bacterium]
MQYINLGSSGLKVSRLALGMMSYGEKTWRPWVLEEKDSLPFVQRALELGVNFFDTADMYSLGASERILGRALKTFGASPDRVVIATKVCSPMSDDPNDRGLSRKHIMQSIDRSLERLGRDYVDLYLMHRADPATPIEETLLAFADLIRAGKILYYGASTMPAWQFARLVYTADRLGAPRPASMQPYYNIVYREEEREMIPFCRAEGIGVTPYSPIARGFVTGERPPETFGETLRAKTDTHMRGLYYKSADYAVVERITA